MDLQSNAPNLFRSVWRSRERTTRWKNGCVRVSTLTVPVLARSVRENTCQFSKARPRIPVIKNVGVFEPQVVVAAAAIVRDDGNSVGYVTTCVLKRRFQCEERRLQCDTRGQRQHQNQG